MKNALLTFSLFAFTFSLPAATCTWNGAWDTTPSSAEDDIVVTADGLVWDSTMPATVASWTQSAGTVTFKTGRDCELRVTGNVTLNGGVWTTPAQPSLTASDAAWQYGQGVYRIVARIGGTFTVGAGASLDVSGKGFNAFEGPGRGSHGGVGWGYYFNGVDWNDEHYYNDADAYGSIKAPVTIGSGSDGFAGGGGIELEVAGAASIAGTLLADGGGETGDDWNDNSYCCAGGGGGIYLKAGSLAGAGTISAANGYLCYAGGGGGRVSVVLTGSGSTFANWTGTIRAVYYFTDWDNWCYNNPTAGTIYLEEAGLNGVGDLIIKDGTSYDEYTYMYFGDPWNSTTPILGSGAAARFRDFTMCNGTMVSIPEGTVMTVERTFIPDANDMDEWGEMYSYDYNYLLLKGGEIKVPSGTVFEHTTVYTREDGSTLTAGDGTGNIQITGACRFWTDGELTINGDFQLQANARTAQFAEPVTINGDMTMGASAYTTCRQTVTINGDLTVANGAQLVSYNAGVNTTDPAKADSGYRFVLNVSGDVTIAAGGYLHAIGYGYYTRWSQLGYLSDANKNDGGAHGGLAAWSSGVLGAYGDVKHPTTLGAGGGNARGGGALRITVGGALTVNGTIAANGAASGTTTLGAGAGGSVWITCGSLVGGADGLITANGGVCQYADSTERSHGGGGRVAVYLTGSGDFSQFPDGNIRAHGGFLAGGGSGQVQGGAGTVYLEQADGTGRLILDNGVASLYADRAATPAATEFSAAVTNYVYSDVLVRNSAWLCPVAGSNFRISGTLTGVDAASEPMGAKGVNFGAAGAIEFTDASVEAHIIGTNLFRSLVCETPGKTIRLDTSANDVCGVGAGGTLRLCGASGNPVVFGNTGATGYFNLYDGGLPDVHYTTVCGLDSSGGAWIVADRDNCTINDDVIYWSLADLTPGAANTWIYAAEPSEKSSLWSDARNWSLGHPPLAGEALIINGGSTVTLPYDTILPALTIGEHGSFSLGGNALKVTGDISVTGELLAENSTLILGGSGVTAALNGASAGTVVVEGDVTFTDAFSAERFEAEAPYATNITFAADKSYVFTDLYVNGEDGGVATIHGVFK